MNPVCNTDFCSATEDIRLQVNWTLNKHKAEKQCLVLSHIKSFNPDNGQ